jgi:membrane-associated PAP2 superfamily phosphatase
LAQQVRGAHFLSHDLWTAFLSWFMSLALYRVFPALSWSVASPAEMSH